jgi:hypothetical protein
VARDRRREKRRNQHRHGAGNLATSRAVALNLMAGDEDAPLRRARNPVGGNRNILAFGCVDRRDGSQTTHATLIDAFRRPQHGHH